MTIAVALSFDSGILLCADTRYPVPAHIPRQSTNIFTRSYGSDPGCARSIFLVSEPVEAVVAALHHCERALDTLQPSEYTICRMQTTIENALLTVDQTSPDAPLESGPEATLLVALYSPVDRQCSLFRTNGIALREFFGYDCQGSAAYFGHCLIHDRYRDAQAMDSLDLTTVFSIATDTLDGARECLGGCGESTEIIVMYANGRASDVHRICRDTRKERKLALLGDPR